MNLYILSTGMHTRVANRGYHLHLQFLLPSLDRRYNLQFQFRIQSSELHAGRRLRHSRVQEWWIVPILLLQLPFDLAGREQ